ncbi:hypothetical protein [Streptomyces sp. NBC_00199]|uniref:hypothetical protein n=1 Tax=Streptomyces sp. NBC_00199 TaxID=2975678 RepID=UPI0022526C02|nr:hypothetical protein [Streptomyces sp. NBC_00199]MCX5267002.1 hypothetical protein [Streptomyces sp. NBC_00199]
MYWAMVGIGVVCVTIMGAMGVAAVTREWVPPRGRRLVLRPRLWGAGALMSAVGLSLFMFLGPLAADRSAVNFYIPPAGMAVNMAGLGLQTLARRPGRTPRLPPASTTAVS